MAIVEPTAEHPPWHRWFCTPLPQPDAPIQLFCLPHAGGGAASFRGWAHALAGGAEVHTVVLPGRETRIAEPPIVDPVALASAITAHADRPFVLYGQSMGGWLGFEVVRALRRSGRPLPTRFYIGGSRPPDLVVTDGLYDGLSGLSDAHLIARLAATGTVPAEVLAEPDLVELLLPGLRADFTWLDGYRFTSEPALPVPLVGFAGRDDPAVPVEAMPGWARHTSAGFTLHLLDGGHLFQVERIAEITTMIRSDLDSANSVAAGVA